MVKKSKRGSQDALKQLLIPQVPTTGPGLGTGMIPGLPEPPNWATPWEVQPQLDTAGGYDKPEHIIPGIGHTPTTPAADEEEKPWPPIQEFIPDPAPDPEDDPLKPPFLLPTGVPPPPGEVPFPDPTVPPILTPVRDPGGYPEGIPTPQPPKTWWIQDRVPDAPQDDCLQWQLLTGLPCEMHGKIQIRSIPARRFPSRSNIRKKNGPHNGTTRSETLPVQRTRHPRHFKRRFRQPREIFPGYLPGRYG